MNLKDISVKIKPDMTEANRTIEKLKEKLRETEESQVNESEEKPVYLWRSDADLKLEMNLPDYDDITPEHPYTQRTIEQATKHLQPELLDSFRNMAVASAFYWVQMRLAGLPEHIAEMAIREWHRSELKVGPGREEYEEALDE